MVNYRDLMILISVFIFYSLLQKNDSKPNKILLSNRSEYSGWNLKGHKQTPGLTMLNVDSYQQTTE
jgi:hypothetical protein